MREELKAANQKILEAKDEEKRKESEDLERIKQHALKKEQLDKLREDKEKEKFSQKQEERQKLIDHQADLLWSMRNNEVLRLN